MAEEKIITSEKIVEIMGERFPEEEIVDYYGEELIIKKTISFEAFSIITRSVANICFNAETGEYLPENFDFAIRLCVIDAYSNVQLPGTDAGRYAVAYRTDLFDSILPYINREQYSELIRATRELIRVRTEANRAQFTRDINMAAEQMNQAVDQVANILNSIDAKDLNAFLGAIGNGEIDEGKIARAVVQEQNKLRESQEPGEIIQFPAEPISEEKTDGE